MVEVGDIKNKMYNDLDERWRADDILVSKQDSDSGDDGSGVWIGNLQVEATQFGGHHIESWEKTLYY